MIERTVIGKKFIECFAGSLDDVEFFSSPGRVNLIGEHIDYNGGLVMPAALTLGIMAAVRWRDDGRVRLLSENCTARLQFNLADKIIFDMEKYDWGNYPRGVMHHLLDEGYALRGCDVLYWGDLPDGAGLSSSAAIEVLTAYMMLYAEQGESIDRVWLAQFAQKVENKFIGVNCGIMDQFAVAMGQENKAIMLDCSDLKYQYIKSVMPGYKLVIMNTNKRRELADSKYNERRSECERALEVLRKTAGKQIDSLCQASINDVERFLQDADILYKRAKHAVTEYQRVQEASICLANGDIAGFGALLSQSHISLRDDYEVTGLELDAIVEAAWGGNGCLGARMTGAGFGGCAIALVEEKQLEKFMKQVGSIYKQKTGLQADFYQSVIGDGVKSVKL